MLRIVEATTYKSFDRLERRCGSWLAARIQVIRLDMRTPGS